ncbi:hypothetical protein PQX77_017707 [Marasmius sp. AFHP31]|nr:hypothetical protein PQX77_017707 [Marasmius sp. AFHP31]
MKTPQGNPEDHQDNLVGKDRGDEEMELDEEKAKQEEETKSRQKEPTDRDRTIGGEMNSVEHLERKLLKLSAESFKKEAELQGKIAELEATASKKNEEIFKLKIQLIENERAEEARRNHKEREEEWARRSFRSRNPGRRSRSPSISHRNSSSNSSQRRSMSPRLRRQSMERRPRSPIRERVLTPTAPRRNTPLSDQQPQNRSEVPKPSPTPLTIPRTTMESKSAPTTTTQTTQSPLMVDEFDHSDYGEESSDQEGQKTKQKARFPKAKKFPIAKGKARNNQDALAFIGDRGAPTSAQLPRLPNYARPVETNRMMIGRAKELMDRAQKAGPDGQAAIREVQMHLTVVQAMRSSGTEINKGSRALEREWRRPPWMHDAAQMRRVMDSNEPLPTKATIDFTTVKDVRGQPRTADPLSIHAAWVALHATYLNYPGVRVPSTLQIEMTTLRACLVFRQLVPNTRRFIRSDGTKVDTKNSEGEGQGLPGVRARNRWIALFIELLTQPYLYEQLIAHWRITIPNTPSPENFWGNASMTMRELVEGLATRGFSVSYSHWMYEWAMNYLQDATLILGDATHAEFPRGQLLARAAKRLREVGPPPTSAFREPRTWYPPSNWDPPSFF